MTKDLYLVDTCSFVLRFVSPAYAELFDHMILKGQFVLSAVVSMELYAGTKNKTAKQELDNLSLGLARSGLLVIPDYSDYQKTGNLLRNYSRQKGAVSVSSHFRDILIGLNAVRMGASIVTENVQDFLRWKKEIKRHLKKDMDVYSAKDLLI